MVEMFTKNLKCALLVAALAGLFVAASAQAGVIAGGNGSFETNTYTSGNQAASGLWFINASGGGASGWTFSGGTRWFMANGCGYGASSDGTYFLNVASWATPMVATTTISGLTVGSQYALTFDVSQRQGLYNSTDAMTVVIDTTTPTSKTITMTDLPSVQSGSADSVNYVSESLTFTATAESQTLTLTGQTEVSAETHNDFVVDNFKVSSVPEPSTLAMLSAGLLGLLAYAWRKQK